MGSPHRYFIEEGADESLATSDMPSCCRKQTNGPVKSFCCTVCGKVWTRTVQVSPRQAFYTGWDGREYPEIS
jgi:hypothetical protein